MMSEVCGIMKADDFAVYIDMAAPHMLSSRVSVS